MSAEEFHELHEHIEHGAHNPEMAPVSLTMAILAVLVAVVTLLGHRMHTEEVVMQTRANDQWAYYQGKDTRLHTDQKLVGLAGVLKGTDSSKAASWIESTKAEADKYDKQKEEIEGLLLNILPAEVAKELQLNGHAKSRNYENVTVLFADFIGFTRVDALQKQYMTGGPA